MKKFAISIGSVLIIAVVGLLVWQTSFPSEIISEVDTAATQPPQTQNDDQPAGGNASSEKPTKNFVLLDVPFVSQAPRANWDDPRQQDGCEEASLLMAWLWITGTTLTPAQAEAKIIDMAEFEARNYGNYVDTSPEDTRRIMLEYFEHQDITIERDITADDIKVQLEQGNLVLVPAHGRALGNPNFTGGGPVTHMLVIRGFDETRRQFITNDPGTRNGREYRYSYSVLMDAIYDYPSGDHVPYEPTGTVMLVVSK